MFNSLWHQRSKRTSAGGSFRAASQRDRLAVQGVELSLSCPDELSAGCLLGPHVSRGVQRQPLCPKLLVQKSTDTGYSGSKLSLQSGCSEQNLRNSCAAKSFLQAGYSINKGQKLSQYQQHTTAKSSQGKSKLGGAQSVDVGAIQQLGSEPSLDVKLSNLIKELWRRKHASSPQSNNASEPGAKPAKDLKIDISEMTYNSAVRLACHTKFMTSESDEPGTSNKKVMNARWANECQDVISPSRAVVYNRGLVLKSGLPLKDVHASMQDVQLWVYKAPLSNDTSQRSRSCAELCQLQEDPLRLHLSVSSQQVHSTKITKALEPLVTIQHPSDGKNMQSIEAG